MFAKLRRCCHGPRPIQEPCGWPGAASVELGDRSSRLPRFGKRENVHALPPHREYKFWNGAHSTRIYPAFLGTSGGFGVLCGASGVQNTGSIPSSSCDWMRQQMLWHSTLHRTSFFMAVSVRHRTWSRNLDLIMLKVASTF